MFGRKKSLFLTCFLALLFGMTTITHAQSNPSIELEIIDEASIFGEMITSITHSGVVGDDRLFISTRAGATYIFVEGALLPSPFLDITNQLYTPFEGGFFRLIFHPDFATNGRFYVNYTYQNPTYDMVSRISQWTVDPDNPNQAKVGSEIPLLEFAQTFYNHNGGDMQFGRDGYLYIASGDGGGSPDGSPAQKLDVLLGKLLRIDVDGGGIPGDCGIVTNYHVPSTNPFVDDSADCNAIWASGLRNPWRFAIDQTNGAIWIADVGDANWEEVDHAAEGVGGLNFGWPCFEGFVAYQPCDSIAHTAPIHVESHDTGHYCSITGGYLYRGSQMATLQGQYLFGDWCGGDYKALGGDLSAPTITLFPNVTKTGAITFGEGSDRELYIGFDDGRIGRLRANTPLSIIAQNYTVDSADTTLWIASAFLAVVTTILCFERLRSTQ